MKIIKIALALVCVCGIGATTTTSAMAAQNFGRRPAMERHPEIRRAMKALERSRDDLMRADRDFGGHRSRAVAAIDRAIEELHQALSYDRH